MTHERRRRARLTALRIGQSTVAVGLAWWLGMDVVDSGSAVFAPISALATLAVSFTARLRRTIEVTLGVALGVLVGDTLIAQIGAGTWQLMFVVALAMTMAVLLGGGAVLVVQAASTAVLVATVEAPTQAGIYIARPLDALIGGGVAIIVNAVFLPLNPITLARRASGQVLDAMTRGLEEMARAMWNRDAAVARAAVEHGFAAEQRVSGFAETLNIAQEVSRIAPVRWRARGELSSYLDAIPHIRRAVADLRVLLQQAQAMLPRGEPAPPGVSQALSTLAEAIRALRDELAGRRATVTAQQRLLEACQHTRASLERAPTLSGHVIVAQVRSTAVDLLEAAGLAHATAREAVARAVEGDRAEPGGGGGDPLTGDGHARPVTPVTSEHPE